MNKNNLCYPNINTWFICWNEDKIELMSYGLITPEQCMKTPWTEIDFYTIESEWLEVLINNNIDPYEE
jgi:hypothetical protein